jgi:hypothetical protein
MTVCLNKKRLCGRQYRFSDNWKQVKRECQSVALSLALVLHQREGETTVDGISSTLTCFQLSLNLYYSATGARAWPSLWCSTSARERVTLWHSLLTCFQLSLNLYYSTTLPCQPV